jgi:hypothetical protein
MKEARHVGFQCGLEFTPMFACGRRCFRFNRLIKLHQLSPERRQLRTAAAASTRRGFDHRKTKGIVQVIDKQPGATVGKPGVSPSLDDRSGLMNLLKELNFARPNRAAAAQIDPLIAPGRLPMLTAAERRPDLRQSISP